MFVAKSYLRRQSKRGVLGSIHLEILQYFIIQLLEILNCSMFVIGLLFLINLVIYQLNCSQQDHTKYDFTFQLPVGANDAELEERIIQHLAAAAAMGRARHIARREGQRNRPSAHGRQQFLVFSTHPNSPPAAPASSSPSQRGESEPGPPVTVAFPSPANVEEESSQLIASLSGTQADHVSSSASGSSVHVAGQQGSPLNNRCMLQLNSEGFPLFDQFIMRSSFELYSLFIIVSYYFSLGGPLINRPKAVKIELGHQTCNPFQNL